MFVTTRLVYLSLLIALSLAWPYNHGQNIARRQTAKHGGPVQISSSSSSSSLASSSSSSVSSSSSSSSPSSGQATSKTTGATSKTTGAVTPTNPQKASSMVANFPSVTGVSIGGAGLTPITITKAPSPTGTGTTATVGFTAGVQSSISSASS